MFEEELKYVQDYLISHNGDNSPRINETFRHRSKHVNNVFRWALRIYNELDYLLQAKIDQNALYLACIFMMLAMDLSIFIIHILLKELIYGKSMLFLSILIRN